MRPEMKARDVQQGWVVVENIISVNYDETGEKWATNGGGGTNFEESCKW